MTWRIILAVIDGAEGSEAALVAAIGLGRTFRARVEVLHVETDLERAVPVVGEGMSGAAIEQIMQSLQAEAQTRLAAARRLYEKHCVAKKVTIVEPDAPIAIGKFAVCFRHAVGGEPEIVLRRARLSDLTVMGRTGHAGEGGTSPTFDAALFDSGRPVLLLPAGLVKAFGTSVAVAWDRSREAVRAVAAALPLMHRAKRVVVMTARNSDSDVEPSELVRYLSGHGIEARTWAFAPPAGPIGEALLAEAAKAKADLLVLGGYGHSRLRELVLGGATRSVLANSDTPLLMAH